MSGVSYWRTAPPSHVDKSIKILQRTNNFSFLEQKGLGRYVVEVNSKRFRLLIGNPHKCECKRGQPCIHVLFILTQHLQIPYASDLLFQEGLNEIILTNLLTELESRVRVDNRCLFCNDQENLVKCNNCSEKFHWICLELATKMRNTPIACPSCKSTVKKGDYLLRNSCSHCKVNLEKSYYRCLFCIAKDVFLCQNCYIDKKVHSLHPFVFETSTPQLFNNTESRRNIVASLQYREINPEDYQALLFLDEGSKTSPLSLEKFWKLERRMCNSLEINSSCPICLERFSKETECIALPCGHVLHIRCGEDWLTLYKDECPVDHAKVNSLEE